MLYGRGSQAVVSRQIPRRSDTAATHLAATTGREEVAMLLRLGVVALLAIGAAAAVIAFAQ